MTRGKLRMALRVRFIEVHKDLISVAVSEMEERHSRGNFSIKITEKEKLIADKMRKQIGYSCRTNDFDMVHSLLRLAKEKCLVCQ